MNLKANLSKELRYADTQAFSRYIVTNYSRDHGTSKEYSLNITLQVDLYTVFIATSFTIFNSRSKQFPELSA